MPRRVEISHRTIIFTVLLLISFWFLYQIRDILVIFFVGLLLMSALNPIVEKLERRRIPRLFSAIVIYVLILVSLGLLLAGIIPMAISQTSALISILPEYLKQLGLTKIDEKIINGQADKLISQLGSISFDVARFALSIFGNFLVVLSLLLVSLYLLLERKKLDEYLLRIFGDGRDRRAAEIVKKIEHKLGGWVRAELMLMTIVGFMSYIGLRLLGIDFALPLAFLAGLLEIVPTIGPIISAIPAVLAGLVISPLTGLSVAALYFLVQQLENHLAVPQVLSKEIGVNPLVTIFALMAGFELGGFLGAVLAIPIVILLETLLFEFLSSKKA